MARGSSKYSDKFKINALLLLQSNSFNKAKTLKEIKISRNTLGLWVRNLGEEVFNKSGITKEDVVLLPTERKDQIVTLRSSMMVKEEEFLQKVYDVRNKAIDKLIDLVDKVKITRDLTDVLRISQEIITGDQIKSLEERRHNSDYFTYVLNQFNIINNNEGKENHINKP